MTDNQIPGPAWIPDFLAALRLTGLVTAGVEAAGVSSGAVYFQRRRNRLFFDAWQAALTPQATASQATPAEALPAKNAGWRSVFLEALAATSNVSVSAARANVPVETVYKRRRGDADFAAKWLEALNEGYDNLEMELVGYLRDPEPKRKMDVTAALRLLAAHRETVERRRALAEEEDEQAVLDSIDAFLEGMRQRRIANEALLAKSDDGDVAE